MSDVSPDAIAVGQARRRVSPKLSTRFEGDRRSTYPTVAI